MKVVLCRLHVMRRPIFSGLGQRCVIETKVAKVVTGLALLVPGERAAINRW